MTNDVSRLVALAFAAALAGILAACGDSGHSLGTSLAPDAGNADAPAAAGGSTGSGGASTATPTGGSTSASGAGGTTSGTTRAGGSMGTGGSGGSSTSMGGAIGGAGGRGGSSIADDAAATSDTAGGTCANRGESCASRPCCGPLVCLSLTSPMTCYESMPPPSDAASGSDARLTTDGKCPACPPMKCAYGSPVDSNGCTVCDCNPPPDGGIDTSGGCSLPEGCIDAGPSTPCPSTPPAKDSTCVGQSVCSYEDCPGTGHTQASCRSGKWAISSGSCGSVICLGVSTGTTCVSGQACLVRVGGTLSVSCIANPCGTGLVSADCSAATAGCTPILSTSSGLTFYCDMCPGDGTCA
jgi:hypothetical protein